MKLAMVGIIVEDIRKSLDFYKSLGFELDQQYGDGYLELKHDGVRISLNSIEMIESVYGFKPSLKGERLELAFDLESEKEVDMKCLDLEEAGYEIFKKPWKAPWNQYYALVKDPDGNILSLFCEL